MGSDHVGRPTLILITLGIFPMNIIHMHNPGITYLNTTYKTGNYAELSGILSLHGWNELLRQLQKLQWQAIHFNCVGHYSCCWGCRRSSIATSRIPHWTLGLPMATLSTVPACGVHDPILE